jgi:hypothetical protein
VEVIAGSAGYPPGRTIIVIVSVGEFLKLHIRDEAIASGDFLDASDLPRFFGFVPVGCLVAVRSTE